MLIERDRSFSDIFYFKVVGEEAMEVCENGPKPKVFESRKLRGQELDQENLRRLPGRGTGISKVLETWQVLRKCKQRNANKAES